MPECPQHHQSETTDYCSVCGVEIAPAAPVASEPPPISDAAPPALPTADAAGHCPQCSAARESAQQVFCEVCGYNFRSARPGVPPPVPAPEPPAAKTAAPTTAPSTAAPQAATANCWHVVIAVDPMLHGTADPAAPTAQPEQTFSLFEPENILGRATPGVRVQVPIARDAGVSRRHAVLLLGADRSLSIRDLGSANGTQLNGAELVPGVTTPLKDGDVLAVGAWTRITIRGVHS